MQQFTDRQIEIMEAATSRIAKYGIQNLTIKTLAEDIGLSEPALYRHFNSKNEILQCILEYFKMEMKNRIQGIVQKKGSSARGEIRAIFNSQLQAFVRKPAVISVIFAEGIFHFDEGLTRQVSELMDMMQGFIKANIARGQANGEYSRLVAASVLTTIIIGGMRITVLKWKLSGHSSNLLKDGMAVLDGVLKMINKE